MGFVMVRQRFIYCGIAAAFILSGEVRAQEDPGLRTSLDAPAQIGETEAGKEPAPPVPITAKPTTLEANPIAEEPPPPRRRTRSAEADSYDPLGIDAGGLTLFPLLRVGAVFSDNPALSSTDRKSDLGVRLRPSLRIASDWVRHELVLEGSGDFIYYNDNSENDSINGEALARLRLDVLRSTTLALEANYSRSEENGSDSEVPDAAIGNRIDQTFGGDVALTHRAGRISTMLRTGAELHYYGDVELAGGGKERNSDREYIEPEVALRVGYEASPALQPFVEAAYTPRFHFDRKDRSGFERNSNGYRLEAGVAFAPSPIWSGELAVTYLLRDYEDDRLEALQALGVRGRVSWRPTELTTFDLTLGTGLNETASTDSSGSRVYEGRLGVSHDLRDYLTLAGSVGLAYEDFQGRDETNLTWRANTGVLWRMNRWLAWTLDYDFIYRDSNLPDTDYYENRVTAGIELSR